MFYFPFRFCRYLERKAVECKFRSSALIHKDTQLLDGARIINIIKEPTAIIVGANTIIRGELVTFGHGGNVKIGEWCYVGEGTRIWSAEQIQIGDRVLIAHNVNIHDSNSHPLNFRERHNHFKKIKEEGHPSKIDNLSSAPVIIEDDCWIGFNSIILKGVTVGRGSIIGAGSIVTKDVPANSFFIHNHAIKGFE